MAQITNRDATVWRFLAFAMVVAPVGVWLIVGNAEAVPDDIYWGVNLIIAAVVLSVLNWRAHKSGRMSNTRYKEIIVRANQPIGFMVNMISRVAVAVMLVLCGLALFMLPHTR